MGTTNSSIKEPKSQKMHIFILSGQSNMAGHGGVLTHPHRWDGVVPPQCMPSPQILRFSSALCWQPANEPLHGDIDVKKTCGVGPGMAFANAVKNSLPFIQAPVKEIGLVPCAVGGTAITKWARGEKLYENMLHRAKSAGKEGEIRAVVWYQGESDTATWHKAKEYKEKMERLICNVRDDLELPSLPFIQVAIASGDKYTEKVREAQKHINLANVVCVDAKGLPLKADNLHLTTEAQVKLGQMLADAYLNNFALPLTSFSVGRLLSYAFKCLFGCSF